MRRTARLRMWTLPGGALTAAERPVAMRSISIVPVSGSVADCCVATRMSRTASSTSSFSTMGRRCRRACASDWRAVRRRGGQDGTSQRGVRARDDRPCRPRRSSSQHQQGKGAAARIPSKVAQLTPTKAGHVQRRAREAHQPDERLELARRGADRLAARAHAAHLDVRLRELIGGLVGEARVAVLARVAARCGRVGREGKGRRG